MEFMILHLFEEHLSKLGYKVLQRIHENYTKQMKSNKT